MKKSIVFCSFLLVNLTLLSCGRKPTENIPLPDEVLASFNASYSDVSDVKWQKLNENNKDVFEADFTRKGKKFEIKYDETGNIIKQQ